jgi:hypothetical protein
VPSNSKFQNADWRVEITALEDEANKAFVDRNLARRDQLLSSELVT